MMNDKRRRTRKCPLGLGIGARTETRRRTFERGTCSALGGGAQGEGGDEKG